MHVTAGSRPVTVDRSRRPARDDAGRARHRRRRRILIAVAVVLVLAVAAAIPTLLRALAGDGTAEAVTGVDRIEVADDRFLPPAVEVPVGTTVTYEWTGGSDHDVRFEDGVTSPVQADGTWTRTFDETGSYPFTCTLHAFMDGRVDVTD